MIEDDLVTQMEPVVDQIGPLLAGHPPRLQGVVIADLLAMHLAGYIIHDDPAETDRLREQLLSVIIDTVRGLIPINAMRLANQDSE